MNLYPPETPRSIGALMGKARQGFNREVTLILRQRGHATIRPAAAQVFRGLDKRGTTITTLAQRAQVTKQTISILVGELKDAGYVSTSPAPEDRRAKVVTLTPKGRRLANHIIEAARVVEARLVSRIGPRRMASVRKGLELIVDEFGETYRTDWFVKGGSAEV